MKRSLPRKRTIQNQSKYGGKNEYHGILQGFDGQARSTQQLGDAEKILFGIHAAHGEHPRAPVCRWLRGFRGQRSRTARNFCASHFPLCAEHGRSSSKYPQAEISRHRDAVSDGEHDKHGQQRICADDLRHICAGRERK